LAFEPPLSNDHFRIYLIGTAAWVEAIGTAARETVDRLI